MTLGVDVPGVVPLGEEAKVRYSNTIARIRTTSSKKMIMRLPVMCAPLRLQVAVLWMNTSTTEYSLKGRGPQTRTGPKPSSLGCVHLT